MFETKSKYVYACFFLMNNLFVAAKLQKASMKTTVYFKNHSFTTLKTSNKNKTSLELCD